MGGGQGVGQGRDAASGQESTTTRTEEQRASCTGASADPSPVSVSHELQERVWETVQSKTLPSRENLKCRITSIQTLMWPLVHCESQAEQWGSRRVLAFPPGQGAQ